MGRHVAVDHGAGAYEGVGTQFVAAYDGCVGADRDAPAHQGRAKLVLPLDLSISDTVARFSALAPVAQVRAGVSVAILVALVQLDALASVDAGMGAVFFGAVVVLTLFAAEAFDPRLIWDAAEEGEALAASAPAAGGVASEGSTA